MDPITLKALRLSIQHWKENECAEHHTSASTKSEDCALCRRFLSRSGACWGCPVEHKTKMRICRKTPYVEAYKMLVHWRQAEGFMNYYTARANFRRAARAQREFLESLLPQD